MRRIGLVALVVIALAVATPAGAAWSGAGAGSARARSTQMPAGNAPSASVNPPNATTVSVSWTAPTGGAPVGGYVVRSYDASTGSERTVGASCAGVVSGTSCSESAVPNGPWTYSVTPTLGSWRGAESPRSIAVTIDSVGPSPTALTLENNSGGIGTGDAINITFSEALAPSSICSTWSGSGDQALTNGTFSVSHGVVTDTFSITSASCALHIGSLSSVSTYTVLGATFVSSTVIWTASTRTLRIVVGTPSGLLSLGVQVVAHAVNYTPHASMTDLVGNSVNAGTFVGNNQRF